MCLCYYLLVYNIGWYCVWVTHSSSCLVVVYVHESPARLEGPLVDLVTLALANVDEVLRKPGKWEGGRMGGEEIINLQ